MAVNLSLIGGAGWQFFDDNGDPLSGGKIYTYAAGTTTPQTTYTSRDGLTPNTNPIILDAAGRTPQEIWSTEGLLYKYVLRTATDTLIRTWDNIGGSVVPSDLETNLASTTDNTKGDAMIGFRQSNAAGFLTGAVARTVNDKLQEYVSVKDFGAVGDGVTDDTVAIQAAFDQCINNLKKHLIFPIGTYRITATITIPPYYSASMPVNYWAPSGHDFHVDFDKAVIFLDNPAGGVGFNVVASAYPSTRYQFQMTGGVFTTTNKLSSVVTISGGAMWNIFFEYMSMYTGSADTFFRVYSDSPIANFGIFSFKNMFVRSDVFCSFVVVSGGIPQSDNFTFDTIYFFGTSDTSRMIDISNGYLLTDSRILNCIQVGSGVIVRGGETGGYLINCMLDSVYSESTTSGNYALINAGLVDCSLSNCRLYIPSSATQNIRWFDGQAVRTTFNGVNISAGNFSGGAPYGSGPYLTLNFGPNSADNEISGYTATQYANAVTGSSGAVSTIPGVSTRDLLTARNTWQPISTTVYTRVGSSIPKASYIGSNRTIELYVEGCTYGSNSKTLAVQFKIGSNTLLIGGNITQSSGTWNASARILLTSTSPTTYAVYLYHGSAVNGSTLITNRLGNPDQSLITASINDPIEFGVNVTTITDGAVVIASGGLSIVNSGTFDSVV